MHNVVDKETQRSWTSQMFYNMDDQMNEKMKIDEKKIMNQWEYYISIQPSMWRNERNIKDEGEILEQGQGNQKKRTMAKDRVNNVGEC